MTAPLPVTVRPSMDLADWYPLLVEAGIPTPLTLALQTDFDLSPLLEEQRPDGFDALIEAVQDAGAEIGYPVFLRTGYTALAREWAKTCFVRRPEDVAGHIFRLVQWSAKQGLPTDTWVLREVLPLRPAFIAFGGQPVTRERRYFFNGLGQVTGHHPYWPVDAFDGARPRTRNGDLTESEARALLAEVNTESAEEVAELTALTERVAATVVGDWSVDFIFVPGRGWVVVDLAHFESSQIDHTHPTAPYTFAQPGSLPLFERGRNTTADAAEDTREIALNPQQDNPATVTVDTVGGSVVGLRPGGVQVDQDDVRLPLFAQGVLDADHLIQGTYPGTLPRP